MSREIDKKSRIGAEIWKAADKQGLTKQDFAKKMGISRQTLDNWIGGVDPGFENVQLASTILDTYFGRKPPDRPFKEEIFEGEYLGVHKRIWEQMELDRITDRQERVKNGDSLRSLSDTLARAVSRLTNS